MALNHLVPEIIGKHNQCLESILAFPGTHPSLSQFSICWTICQRMFLQIDLIEFPNDRLVELLFKFGVIRGNVYWADLRSETPNPEHFHLNLKKKFRISAITCLSLPVYGTETTSN